MKIAPDDSHYQSIQVESRMILLVSPDRIFGAELSRQLNYFGYEVQQVSSLENINDLSGNQKRIAILFDLSPIETESPEDDLFLELKKGLIPPLPRIFISALNGHVVRAKAIHAGGVGFFLKPLDIVRLVDKLDSLNDESPGAPYRILIIDNQEPVAKYYQMVLRMAGMETQISADPGDVLNLLEDFHPDLILLDLFLPQISGLDLARIIRQMDEYVYIPILFISNEDDFNKQVEALSLGGDDFLLKPIKAAHLVALVKSRLERLKTLRSFIVRDSLTGLLNHTSFLDTMYYEYGRSLRSHSEMALVMLDIDHFKKINDAYGHVVGDTVLKSLARLVRQRVRRSDLIGRYGGEEFVILFLDTTKENAFRIIDEIRQNFSEIEFKSRDLISFSVTFSSGIAAFPEFSTPDILIDAADQAMYKAKENHRNCIVLARK